MPRECDLPRFILENEQIDKLTELASRGDLFEIEDGDDLVAWVTDLEKSLRKTQAELGSLRSIVHRRAEELKALALA